MECLHKLPDNRRRGIRIAKHNGEKIARIRVFGGGSTGDDKTISEKYTIR
jgi:hypothetical protein